MPFGAIFGSLYFVLVAVLFVLPQWRMMHPAFRTTEMLLGLLAVLVAVGLLRRAAWSRWLGIGIGALFAVMIGFAAASPAAMLVSLAGSITSVLLLIPATGKLSAGPSAAATPSTGDGAVSLDRPADGSAVESVVVSGNRGSRVLGFLSTATLLAAIVSFAWTAMVRRAPSDPDLKAIGIHRVEWEEFGPGLDRAAAEGRPVLVDFFATWCGPCKAMDRKTFRDPEVVRALEEIVPVRIDAEGTEAVHGFVGEALATKYRVVSYPTLILMDGAGTEIARSRGYKNPAQFLAWLRSALPASRAGMQADISADSSVDPPSM